MTDPVPAIIEIPSAISPAEAEDYRMLALSALETAKDRSTAVKLDVEEAALTPVATQLLIATTRTAERYGVTLNTSEQCQRVLTELHLN